MSLLSVKCSRAYLRFGFVLLLIFVHLLDKKGRSYLRVREKSHHTSTLVWCEYMKCLKRLCTQFPGRRSHGALEVRKVSVKYFKQCIGICAARSTPRPGRT